MGVDYQSMSARELQQACRDRGLPTARDKDTMIARLVEADGTQETGDTVEAALGGPESVLSAPLARTAGFSVDDKPQPAPAVWQERYPVHEGGLTDAEHTVNRAAVAAAAAAHGYQTLGDGHRTGTVDGWHVYEVHLRRGLA
jgi:hypothetical protein